MKKSEIKKILRGMKNDRGYFPKLSDIAEELKISYTATKKIIALLVEDGFLIKTKNNWYKIVEPATKSHSISNQASKLHQPNKNKISTSIDIEMHPLDNKESKFLPKEEEPHIMEEIEQRILGEYKDISNNESEIKKQEVLQKTLDEMKPEPPPKRNIQEDVKLPKINKTNIPIKIIQFCMSIIGIGAVCISVYYTAIWMFEFLPVVLGFLLSSIMVGFSVTAFETIIIFLSGQIQVGRVAKLSIISGFIVLWLIVIVFSIISTVAGQYNQYVKNTKQSAVENTDITMAKIKWNSIQEQKQELRTQLKENRESLQQLLEISKSIGNTVDSRKEHNTMFVDTQYRINIINRQRTLLNKRLTQLYEVEAEELKNQTGASIKIDSKVSNAPDFYSWISKLFGVSKDLAQFWMSLFPAIFVDLIAPVALAVALFLNKKKD